MSKTDSDPLVRSASYAFQLRKAIADPDCDPNELEILVSQSENEVAALLHGSSGAFWMIFCALVRYISSSRLSIAIARGLSGDLALEKERRATLLDHLRGLLDSHPLNTCDPIKQVKLVASENSPLLNRVVDAALGLPLPLLYFPAANRPSRSLMKHQVDDLVTPSVVYVVASLDNRPIVTPQIIRSNVRYKLTLRIRGVAWPDGATRLALDFLTTCPASEYSVSNFYIDRDAIADNGFPEAYSVSGNLRFLAVQSSLAADLSLTTRAAFHFGAEVMKEVPVIGHNEICVRVANEDQHPRLAGNRQLDKHLNQTLEDLCDKYPSARPEINDMCPLLEALYFLLSAYAQEAAFKGQAKVSEADFQQQVLRDLRLQLGPEVLEGPRKAGGIQDIQFRGTTLELKVECSIRDHQKIAEKYSSQATQYSGVEGRQASLLLVLDVTEKVEPPGDIRNNVITRDVPTHGNPPGQSAFPSFAIVFIVGGNFKSPSSYSR